MTTKDTLIHEDGFGIVRPGGEVGKEENPFQIVRRYSCESIIRIVNKIEYIYRQDTR